MLLRDAAVGVGLIDAFRDGHSGQKSAAKELKRYQVINNPLSFVYIIPILPLRCHPRSRSKQSYSIWTVLFAVRRSSLPPLAQKRSLWISDQLNQNRQYTSCQCNLGLFRQRVQPESRGGSQEYVSVLPTKCIKRYTDEVASHGTRTVDNLRKWCGITDPKQLQVCSASSPQPALKDQLTRRM